MENLRAYMIVNAVKECDVEFRCYPSDMDSNSETAGVIAEDGFFMAFDSREAASRAEDVLKSQNHIRSYELADVPETDEEENEKDTHSSVSKDGGSRADVSQTAGEALPPLRFIPPPGLLSALPRERPFLSPPMLR